MTTLAQMEDRINVSVFDYLARDSEVPVVSRAACQGDVSILRITEQPARTPVPSVGVVVVAAESNSGNTHAIHGTGPVFFDAVAARDGSLTLGTLTVTDGAVAVLAHPEHGFLEVAPGTYRIGRQREYAGEWRIVAD